MPLSRRAAIGLVAAVCVVFYGFAPPAKFLQWDDAANLLNHDKWRGLSWDHLKWMWSTRHYGPWQPLSWLSWAFDFKLWGLDPEAFRRTNVALHSITAGLFLLACRRLLPREKPFPFGAAGAALFFALHPLRVESVVWITERRDVLSGFFAVLSIYLWLIERRRLSALTFLGAVLSKGTAIAVVPFIFAVEVFIRRQPARKTVASLLPHAVIALFAAGQNLGGFQTGDLKGLNLGFIDRVLVAGSGAWFYLSKTILPVDLSPYYALPLNDNGIRQASYPGALLALLISVLCFHRRVRAWAGPVWFSYLIALAPVSGLFQAGRQAAADRYSYLACMPFAVLFGYGIERLYLRRPRAAAAILTGVTIFFAGAAIRQTSYWRDDITLWARAVAVEPDAYLPRSNLSMALLASGDRIAAIPHLESAIILESRDVEARVNLGSVLAGLGDRARAEKLFREALALRPGDAPAAVNLASLRVAAGDRKDAVRVLEDVISRDPSFAAAHFNLGLLLTQDGRKSDGLAHLREAVRLDPSLEKRLRR